MAVNTTKIWQGLVEKINHALNAGAPGRSGQSWVALLWALPILIVVSFTML